MPDDIMKALSESYNRVSDDAYMTEASTLDSIFGDKINVLSSEMMKLYDAEEKRIEAIKKAEAKRFETLFKNELKAEKFSQKVKADLLKQENDHYTSLYNLKQNLHKKEVTLLEDERKIRQQIAQSGKVTLGDLASLYTKQREIAKLEKETLEYKEQQFKKGVDNVKQAFRTITDHILKYFNERDNIMVWNQWESGIKNLGSAYEERFTEIAARTGSSSQIDTHNLIGSGLDKILADSELAKGLNFNSEVFPAITDAVQKGFMNEEAIEVAIDNAIDKKVAPWLDTSSETWVNLQYQLSDDMLAQLKGQQLLLQETREGNRILQNGVVSALLDELAPTLLNIDANTTDVTDLSGQAQSMVASLMANGYSKQDAVKVANQTIDAYQNPFNNLSGNSSTWQKLLAIGGLQGNDLAGAMNFATGAISPFNNGTWQAGGAVAANLGVPTNGFTRNTNYIEDLLNASKAANDYSKRGDLSTVYNMKVANINELTTATQQNDNLKQNEAADSVFDKNLMRHGIDLAALQLNELKEIKTWLITGLAAWALGKFTDKITDGFVSKFLSKFKTNLTGGGGSPGGGAGLGGLFTPTAGAGAGGLTSAMSVPAVGLAGGAIGAGLATYGYNNMSDYNKENRTGLAISSGTGATLGAAGGAMLAGGAIAGMAGVGVANAWNPVGWGLLIASAVTLVATEIYDAATSIGGSARQVEAEYEAEKERINKQFRDQKDTLETIQSNLENNNDLETQRSLLINSGILSEHDIEIARNTNKEGLEKLTTAYLTATGKISPEIENDLDKYEQSDKAMAEDLQKNFRSVANKYLDDGKLTSGSDELKAVDTMLYTIYKDLDANSGKYDSWTEETQDLYDNLVKAYKDGKLTSKEVNWVIDEGWRNQSFVEANISADALNAGYKKIMANDSTSSFGNEMGISGTFHGTERATEAVTLANQALLQTSKEGAKEYLDKAKAQGYTSSEFSEIKEAADKWGLTGYRIGSAYIPNDMIAMLHAGERVLTAGQNKEYTNELTSGNSASSIIRAGVQDIVIAIKTQTSEIINYLSTMSFNNSSFGSSHINMLPAMGNTKVTL